MPNSKVKVVKRYYLLNEYLTCLKISRDLQSPTGLIVTEKLLWSWDFTHSPDKYNVKENQDKNYYGKGFLFASSAAIASKLKKDSQKRLVLAMVLVGKTYYTKGSPFNRYEAVSEHFNTLACYYDNDGIPGWIYVIPDAQRILPMYVIDWE